MGDVLMDWNNFLIQLDYRTPFNKEEQELYESICQGLDRQLSATIDWLKSDEAKQFYRERAEYLDWLWANEIDLENQLDNLINYNSSASTDEFMSRFYHIGCAIGAAQLKRELAYTPADEETLNFIRQTNYGYIKNLNNDMKDSIRKTIFEDVAQGNSYQKTIAKVRKLPLTPVAKGKLSPDVRARMIARTERARARGFGTLQSYANYGVEYYDLITRGKKACNICIDLEEHNPYPITDPTAFIPIHPNCICSVGPHIPDGQTLSSTPVDFPISISDYVNLTMQPRNGGIKI
jgi:SPP1 gp7 family putative phage head morphogenesis protein